MEDKLLGRKVTVNIAMAVLKINVRRAPFAGVDSLSVSGKVAGYVLVVMPREDLDVVLCPFHGHCSCKHIFTRSDLTESWVLTNAAIVICPCAIHVACRAALALGLGWWVLISIVAVIGSSYRSALALAI